MITGLRYTNSAGSAFDFDAAGIHPAPSSIWDWEYEANELNGNIASYSRGSSDIDIPVAFASNAVPREAMDTLYAVCAYDLARDATGTLAMGEWSMPAALVKSVKEGWWRPDGPVVYTLTFHSPEPWWTRAVAHQFARFDGETGGLDYPHDYGFDYGVSGGADVVSVGGAYPADFLLRVYGPASDPNVIVGGNSYYVQVEVPAGGLLEVDSRAGTVVLKDAQGNSTNAFPDAPDEGAGSGRYILQQMEPGELGVTWDGTFGFDLTVYERQDERTWSE